MAAEVQITLNATDNASRVIQKTNGELVAMTQNGANARDFAKGLGLDFDSMTNPAQLAGQAIKKVGDYLAESVGKAADYGKQVGDVSRQLGISAQEASKLIQVADDLEIEFGTLKTALKAAQKDGLSPTLDGIKELAAQYQQLQTPTEKAAFAMDKFGRAGIEMQKFLELAPEQLDEFAQGAIDAGLVLDGEGVQAAKDYRMAMDNLNDTFEGLQITLGTNLIPVVTDFLGLMSTGISNGQELFGMYTQIFDLIGQRLYPAYGDMRQAQEELNEKEAYALEHAAEYEDGHTRAAAAMSAAAEAAGDEATAINDLNEYTIDANTAMRDFTTTLLFQQASKALDPEAALALARAMGLVDERTVYATQRLAELKTEYDKNKDGVIDATEAANGYTEAILRMNAALNAIPKGAPLPTGTSGGGQVGGGGTGGSGNSNAGNGGTIAAYASGGPVVAGRPYIVGEQGPEMFVPGSAGSIVPASASRAIVNNYISAGNMDANSLAMQLAHEIGRW